MQSHSKTLNCLCKRYLEHQTEPVFNLTSEQELSTFEIYWFMLHDQNDTSKRVTHIPGGCPAEGLGTDITSCLESRKMLLWEHSLYEERGGVSILYVGCISCMLCVGIWCFCGFHRFMDNVNWWVHLLLQQGGFRPVQSCWERCHQKSSRFLNTGSSQDNFRISNYIASHLWNRHTSDIQRCTGPITFQIY